MYTRTLKSMAQQDNTKNNMFILKTSNSSTAKQLAQFGVLRLGWFITDHGVKFAILVEVMKVHVH